MNNEEKLKMMKLRILRSFKWREDIVVPLSNEFNISIEEFEDILMNHLDMSDLEAIHGTFEVANHDALVRRLHLDLRLYWLADVLKLISKEDYDKIELNLAKEILAGKDYEDALKEGRNEIITILENNN